MKKDNKFVSIDDLDLTPKEREEHFFKKGYEYAMLHLHFGLEEEKLTGLEKKLMKHLDFLESCKSLKGKKK